MIWTSQQQTFIENPRQYISALCHSSFIFRRWDELSCCALPAYNVILIVFMYQVDNVILKIDYCCKTSCMYQHQFLPASILYYYFFLFTWGVIFFYSYEEKIALLALVQSSLWENANTVSLNSSITSNLMTFLRKSYLVKKWKKKQKKTLAVARNQTHLV